MNTRTIDNASGNVVLTASAHVSRKNVVLFLRELMSSPEVFKISAVEQDCGFIITWNYYAPVMFTFISGCTTPQELHVQDCDLTTLTSSTLTTLTTTGIAKKI